MTPASNDHRVGESWSAARTLALPTEEASSITLLCRLGVSRLPPIDFRHPNDARSALKDLGVFASEFFQRSIFRPNLPDSETSAHRMRAVCRSKRTMVRAPTLHHSVIHNSHLPIQLLLSSALALLVPSASVDAIPTTRTSSPRVSFP